MSLTDPMMSAIQKASKSNFLSPVVRTDASAPPKASHVQPKARPTQSPHAATKTGAAGSSLEGKQL